MIVSVCMVMSNQYVNYKCDTFGFSLCSFSRSIVSFSIVQYDFSTDNATVHGQIEVQSMPWPPHIWHSYRNQIPGPKAYN